MILRLSIALVLASAAGAASAQTTYRCKDVHGRISYSDHACPGQAAAPLQRRGKLESDCAQGSKDACAELNQGRRRSAPSAAAGKPAQKNSEPKRSTD